ncbi:MAG: TonB-dependent receptor [Thermoanaerobaculia bacterium]
MSRRLIWLLAAALTTTAAVADDREAAEAEPATPTPTLEDEVWIEESLPYAPTSNTIATKLPVAQSWTPANVGVVDRDLFEEQGATVLGDALENISGVGVQTGFGLFDLFVLRGFDSLSGGLILTDGAPEPESSFYQLYNTERVELFKGPAGFLYGGNPLAGLVNLVRKAPLPASFFVIGAAGGSFGMLEGSLDANWGDGGPWSLRLNSLWRQGDGHRDGLDHDTLAVNPVIAWRPDERTSLTVGLEWMEADFQPDAGIPVIDGRIAAVPRERSYASPFDRSVQEIGRLQLDFERRLSDRTTLRNKTYARQLDWLSDGTLLGFVFPNAAGSLDVSRTLLLLDDRQEFVGNQLELVLSRETGTVTHRLLAGIEVTRFADEFTLDVALLPTIDIFQPVETAVGRPFVLPGFSSAGDARSTVVAPYFVDQIALSERLQLLAGARWDSIDFDDAVSGISRSQSELSPMLGLVFRAGDTVSLYANAGRSFAPPSPRVFDAPEPEKSRQVEVGARWSAAGGRVRTTLAAYELQRDNIAIPDDNGFTQQAGDQRSRGLELEVAANPGRGWRSHFNYAYNDAELTRFSELVQLPFPPGFLVFDRSGNRPAFAPEHLAGLWVGRRFASGWNFGGGGRWVGEQFIAEDNATRLGSYALLDLSAGRTFGAWRWSLHLENLTDEEYETRGFGGASVIPGRPFSASLRLEVRP